VFKETKLCLKIKKEEGILFIFLSYGLFLVTRTASTAPMITMTMIIAAIPYMRVLFEANSDTAGAVGAGVAGSLNLL